MITQFRYHISQLRIKTLLLYSPQRQYLSNIPEGLLAHWQATAPHEFTDLPTDSLTFYRAAEGLMQFFTCVKRSKHACALPSRAADSIWHAWNSWSATGLDSFCQRYFGRSIPHIEAQDMAGSLEHALAATLVAARKIERRTPVGTSIPTVFRLDKVLKIAGGYAYGHKDGRVGFQVMNDSGKASGKINYPASFEAAQLLALGLISQEMYDRKQLAPEYNYIGTYSGASCGSNPGNCAVDAGSAHCTGSSCGSSGGASCGGGGS